MDTKKIEEQNEYLREKLEKQYQKILATLTLSDDVREKLETLKTNFEEEVRQNPQDAISAYETYDAEVKTLLKG